MRKLIISGIIFIYIGFLLGDFIFSNENKLLNKLSPSENFYFLQEGIYGDKDMLNNNLSKLNLKTIDKVDNKYYVYVGITKDIELAKRIKDIYKEEGINVYLKEKKLSSKEFSTNLSQFDLLLSKTKDKDEILTIEEVVLANYEEIVKKE